MYPYILIILLLFNASYIKSQDAREIVKKADERSKGISSIGEMTVQTIRPDWSREMKIKVWSKGNDMALILISSPAKEKGIVYLRKKKEVWNWIPSIERNIKMPPSMMSQSWMGTDFTNDDLVKEASILDDYVHSMMKDTLIDGKMCFTIKMIPKPTSAVVWGKVIMCIDKKDFIILHVTYYDEDGTLVNTMQGKEIKLLGNRLLPSRLEMIPADKKGHKTILIYNVLKFDVPIEDKFFSPQNMPKVK
jgi:outer membrane lipoprotein-sorting protein